MNVTHPPGLRGVAVIGTSAGGVEVLRRLVGALPTDLPIAVCVVLHIPATSRSVLAAIVARSTSACVLTAADGMRPEAGHIYVAPPDRHLIVRRDRLELDAGPRENSVRPAIDPLFRSAAAAFGANSVAIVLSGALSDGAAGAAAVAQAGGTVLVQDPEDALVPSMPEAALQAVPAAVTADATALAGLVAGFARTLEELEEEEVMAADQEHTPVELSRRRPSGPPSVFTCPECHGPLWEVSDREPSRYRCRVGHAYHEDHLVAEKSTEVEAALWAALEALEERAELLAKVAHRLDAAGDDESARGYLESVAATRQRAQVLRGVLLTSADAPETVAG